jgi:hypothetical protein
MNVTLTAHVIKKIAESEDPATVRTQVLLAASQPQVRYQSRRGEGVSYRHVRDGIVAVVGETGRVITFYIDQDETDLRPDQTDPDAQAYDAARRKSDRAIREQKRNARRDRDRALTAAMKSGRKA